VHLTPEAQMLCLSPLMLIRRGYAALPLSCVITPGFNRDCTGREQLQHIERTLCTLANGYIVVLIEPSAYTTLLLQPTLNLIRWP
jgi:hypothetical protein